MPVNFKITVSVFILFAFYSKAQFNILNNDIKWMFDKELSKGDTILNSNINSLEAYFVFEDLPSDSFLYPVKSPFFNWMFNKNIYGVKNEKYSFRLNPIFDISTGSD